MSRRLCAVALAGAIIAACGQGSRDAGPAPRPLSGSAATEAAPSAGEQARTIAANPRLLLFDLQTALQGVEGTRGSYPTVDEFRAAESWELQRAALDAAFSEWTYESDGATYSLSGEAGGRTFEIHSH